MKQCTGDRSLSVYGGKEGRDDDVIFSDASEINGLTQG
jgi:hypothetical protein